MLRSITLKLGAVKNRFNEKTDRPIPLSVLLPAHQYQRLAVETEIEEPWR